MAELAADPHTRGALITSHKTGVHAAASDLFDELDDYARLCGEISSSPSGTGGWRARPETS
ncbi:hypothetical protein ACFQYP_13500 [Nonomuraea antimicrobica]